MEFLTIREFSKSPKTALAKLGKTGKAVLTNNGKPAAIMLNVSTENFEKIFGLMQQIDMEKKINKLERAAALAFEDYTNNKELTVFTALDGEPFHETG